jgi:hypothetical protein
MTRRIDGGSHRSIGKRGEAFVACDAEQPGPAKSERVQVKGDGWRMAIGWAIDFHQLQSRDGQSIDLPMQFLKDGVLGGAPSGLRQGVVDNVAYSALPLPCMDFPGPPRRGIRASRFPSQVLGAYASFTTRGICPNVVM